ncbi:DUF2304 domain-containing protein [Paenibacillus sp. CMAA1739]|uniref:DUF2304 domain-containing protein n=1 Tax=Paenibacillus ottowii TaxID=2315729 RepID=UPI00272FC73F|nr:MULTISPECIES: DUF2304 domain-containing protein [Paenibacillus]MDP1510161.1 DUF2304 domain-containing protein [Paenibacillus ottowii]MEC4565577.1 DUF2304 domain-containing protein [Paenibacillus sp. CMAA1739]
MIHFQLQVILFFVCSILLMLLIRKIKSYKLDLKYALLWILINLMGIVLTLFPYVLIFISRIFYIEMPVNALFLVAIISIFVILYSLTVALSRDSNKIKVLSQEIGLLKKEVDLLKGKHLNLKGSSHEK